VTEAKTFYSFFYNNVDWIIASSYYASNGLQDSYGVSGDCMVFSSTWNANEAKEQLFAYSTTGWKFITYYDEYTKSNTSSNISISKNGQYIICTGNGRIGDIAAQNLLCIRIYKINYYICFQYMAAVYIKNIIRSLKK